MSRKSDNRTKESSGRNTPASGRVQSVSKPVMNRINSHPQCSKCKKRYVREYQTITGCYNCVQEGYYARNYPTQSNKISPPTPAPRGRLNTRVYSLNKGVISAGLSTSVSGQLTVSNLPLYTLIDSGATHLFIASRLYDKLEGNR